MVFAVMGYVISEQRPPDFVVELNARLLSAILGEPEDEVQRAIDFLCAPDPGSRTDKEEGRRLIKVGAFTYHVVNGEMYHSIRNYEERKAYNRDAQAKYREKKKLEGIEIPAPKEGVKRFQKPTIPELIEAGLDEKNANKFLNHFESNGWKVGGKGAMKDWRAAVRNWQSNDFNGSPQINGARAKRLSEMTKEEEAQMVREAQQ